MTTVDDAKDRRIKPFNRPLTIHSELTESNLRLNVGSYYRRPLHVASASVRPEYLCIYLGRQFYEVLRTI